MAADANSGNRMVGVGGDTHDWADTAARGAWMATCGVRLCARGASDWSLLAPLDFLRRGGGETAGVVVMNTTNFDGQWTRKVIERLGFGTAQGSSSRGGLKGLVVMAQRLKEGHDVAFTIDGPRGPRYVAKPVPVMLARKTGQPIFLFHIGLERATTFEKSWDLFQVPHLFSRAIAVVAPTIYVPADASRELMEEKHEEMQRSLERVRDVAESWFALSESERERVRHEWNA